MRINVTPSQVRNLLESLGRITVGRLIIADDLTEDEINAVADLFEPWTVGEAVKVGYIRRYENLIYNCVRAHITQADWTPDIVPALWVVVAAPGVIPVWVQPINAETSYNIDDQVQWPEGGTVWRSTINANTTVPGENQAHGYWVEVI